jgi:protein PhnA
MCIIQKNKILREVMSCQLCSKNSVEVKYEIEPKSSNFDNSIEICNRCKEAIENPKENSDYLNFLVDTLWSENSAIKVLSYKLLNDLREHSWAQDALDIAYLDENEQKWADSLIEASNNEVVTLDSNGVKLESGDSVTIIKDLQVKGAGFTAKRGTVVKNIHLTNTPGEIEGRVNGVRIVLLSKYLKKSS